MYVSRLMQYVYSHTNLEPVSYSVLDRQTYIRFALVRTETIHATNY